MGSITTDTHVHGVRQWRPKTMTIKDIKLREICQTMSNEFVCSEETVHVAGNCAAGPFIHRVPAQSVELKIRLIMNALFRAFLRTWIIFAINVRNNGPPKQLYFQRTPWWCFLKMVWPWIWRLLKSTTLVFHVFIPVAVWPSWYTIPTCTYVVVRSTYVRSVTVWVRI